MEYLDDGSFVLYAAKHYDNPSCHSMDEFHSDLAKFKYVRRLFTKYLETGVLKERLILNHLIVIYNLFGPEPATRMLFYRLQGQWEPLKPFLEFLGYLPEVIHHVGHHPAIVTNEIQGDKFITNTLKDL